MLLGEWACLLCLSVCSAPCKSFKGGTYIGFIIQKLQIPFLFLFAQIPWVRYWLIQFLTLKNFTIAFLTSCSSSYDFPNVVVIFVDNRYSIQNLLKHEFFEDTGFRVELVEDTNTDNIQLQLRVEDPKKQETGGNAEQIYLKRLESSN